MHRFLCVASQKKEQKQLEKSQQQRQNRLTTTEQQLKKEPIKDRARTEEKEKTEDRTQKHRKTEQTTVLWTLLQCFGLVLDVLEAWEHFQRLPGSRTLHLHRL